jgi:superfamily II DNA or RNA helicase
MLKQFRSPDHKIQVLVANAMRNYFGLNMQGACANCIFVTEPTSRPRAQQQIGRILRLRALHEWIRVITLTSNSY